MCFNRNDPAWKALYSLYNPDNLQGKAAGQQYSLQNRQATQKRVAARAAATAAAAAAARSAEQQKKPSPKKKVTKVGAGCKRSATAKAGIIGSLAVTGLSDLSDR